MITYPPRPLPAYAIIQFVCLGLFCAGFALFMWHNLHEFLRRFDPKDRE